MSTPYESADLILKLYELRREATMRQARNWFITFTPDSVDDIVKTLHGEHSASYRMVTSYWDMAASFVNNGAIDEQMFNAATGEQVIVIAKIQPFLEEYRAKMQQPGALKNLEQLVMRMPNIADRLPALRERFRQAPKAAKA